MYDKECTYNVGVVISIYLLYAAGRDFKFKYERLEMTSGERKCWNITILDDSIDEMDMEQFFLYLFPRNASVAATSARVHITDNDGGMWKTGS